MSRPEARGPEEYRRELKEELLELARAIRELTSSIESIKSEIIHAVEDALGVPLTPETLRIMRLYSFRGPREEDAEALRRLVARYMGLEEGVDVVEYLKSLSGGGPGSKRAGWEERTRDGAGEG